MKSLLKGGMPALVVFALFGALLYSVASAQNYISDPYVGAGQLVVGADGTKMNRVLVGTLTIASGDTSGTLSLTGVTSADMVLATINTGNSSSRSILRATPGTDSVLVLLSGTPGASTIVTVTAIKGA